MSNAERAGSQGLTKEQMKAADELMEGVPRLNLGAFIMPAIWGPAHGLWVAIIFYPLWMVADNCFVMAVCQRTPLAIILGVLAFVGMVAVTLVFAVASQPYALARWLNMGKTKEAYLARQRIWAVCMAVIGAVFVTLATLYNLFFNPDIVPLGWFA